MTPVVPSPLSALRTRNDETVARQRVEVRLQSATSTATKQTSKATATDSQPQQAKLRQAAQDFEAVFLRQMLSCLERTTKVSSKNENIAGQGTYGSMIVDSVAEAVAKAGGLGLADMMAKAMEERLPAQDTKKSKVDPSTPGTTPVRDNSALRSSIIKTKHSEDGRISPQGLTQPAVPRTEIRASASPVKGPLADRRIR